MATPRRGLPVERATSAGGVVCRGGALGWEVVICGRDADGVWGLPKGTPDQGESLEQTAVREVTEETGLDVRVIDKVGVIEYWFARGRVRYHKWVHYYLMEAIGGDTVKHDAEYDRVDWQPLEVALKTLTFQNEIEIAARAAELMEKRS